jgi:hypothetical protein
VAAGSKEVEIPDDVKLNDGYSLTKGMKKAFMSTVLPALGAAVAGLLLDPSFVALLQEHTSTMAGGGALTFVLFLAVNWAKNRGK